MIFNKDLVRNFYDQITVVSSSTFILPPSLLISSPSSGISMEAKEAQPSTTVVSTQTQPITEPETSIRPEEESGTAEHNLSELLARDTVCMFSSSFLSI